MRASWTAAAAPPAEPRARSPPSGPARPDKAPGYRARWKIIRLALAYLKIKTHTQTQDYLFF